MEIEYEEADTMSKFDQNGLKVQPSMRSPVEARSMACTFMKLGRMI